MDLGGGWTFFGGRGGCGWHFGVGACCCSDIAAMLGGGRVAKREGCCKVLGGVWGVKVGATRIL